MSRYHVASRIAASETLRSWIGHHDGHEIEVESWFRGGGLTILPVSPEFGAQLLIDGKLRDHVDKLPAVLRADLSETAASGRPPLNVETLHTELQELHGAEATKKLLRVSVRPGLLAGWPKVRATIGGRPFELQRVRPGKPYGE